MKLIKKPKKAVWKGWGIKDMQTGYFIYYDSPTLSKAKDEFILESHEEVVKVELREV